MKDPVPPNAENNILTGSNAACEQSSERRRKQRFLAKNGCLVSLGNDPIKPWQILDISEEGLAFRYIGGVDEPQGVFQLDILTGDTALCIEAVPVRVISDLGLSGQLPRQCLKRCSVQFGNLSPDQLDQLGSFIRDYTALHSSPATLPDSP